MDEKRLKEIENQLELQKHHNDERWAFLVQRCNALEDQQRQQCYPQQQAYLQPPPKNQCYPQPLGEWGLEDFLNAVPTGCMLVFENGPKDIGRIVKEASANIDEGSLFVRSSWRKEDTGELLEPRHVVRLVHDFRREPGSTVTIVLDSILKKHPRAWW